MIFGFFQADRAADDLVGLLTELGRRSGSDAAPNQRWVGRAAGFCVVPRRIESFDEGPQPFTSEDGSVVLAFEGKIHNLPEIEERLGRSVELHRDRSGQALVHLYQEDPENFLASVNGKFAFALWDGGRERLLLGRDRLGIEALFFHQAGGRLLFSTDLKTLVGSGEVERGLNHEAVLQYLLYCYNPLDETLFRGVHKLPAGHLLACDRTGVSIRPYWSLSFSETGPAAEDEYRHEFLEMFRDAVRIRLDPGRAPGVLLSGGTDSSAILSLTSELRPDPVRTFSFRCRGRSYDEAQYARLVAERFGAQYNEVPYGPDRVQQMVDVVRAMDEPFCDIGIELATFILGRAAGEQVSYVLNGEGGDELFAGHPVYVADKVAPIADLVPRFLMRPVTAVLQKIPDSDEKKNLQVMLKRFSYSLQFPRQLLAHRWRVYYTVAELRQLCSDDFLAECDLGAVFEGMIRHGRDADGPDRLSRSLQSDFTTLVDFYLRRLELLAASGVESRPPLLDHRLVEYSTRIPSKLKIKGLSETKYLYRKILEPIVPREILYDRPKLGHSVPMKNWLREDPEVTAWMMDAISDPSFVALGFFRQDYVESLVDGHRSKKHNHSHRLWALSILALWLREMDQAAG